MSPLLTINYYILKHLYEIKNQSDTAYISQEELADKFKISKQTVNKAMRILRENQFITNYTKKQARYNITEKGKRIVKQIMKTEAKKGTKN